MSPLDVVVVHCICTKTKQCRSHSIPSHLPLHFTHPECQVTKYVYNIGSILPILFIYFPVNYNLDVILAGCIIVSTDRCLFAAISCLLTQGREEEGAKGPIGREEEEMCMH